MCHSLLEGRLCVHPLMSPIMLLADHLVVLFLSQGESLGKDVKTPKRLGTLTKGFLDSNLSLGLLCVKTAPG